MFACCNKEELIQTRTSCLTLVRVYYIYHVFYTSYDVTWWAGPAYLCMCLEATLGVICASLPSLKVFFKRYSGGSQAKDSYLMTGSKTSRSRGFITSNVGTELQSAHAFGHNAHDVETAKHDFSGGSEEDEKEYRSGRVNPEIGNISVVREIDVTSEHLSGIVPAAHYSRNTRSSSGAPFKSGRPTNFEPINDYRSREKEAWLEENSPPGTTRNSSERWSDV